MDNKHEGGKTVEEKAKVIVDTIFTLNEQFDLMGFEYDASFRGMTIAEHMKQGLNPYIDMLGYNDGKTLLEASKIIPDIEDYLSKENKIKLNMEKLKKELYPMQEKKQSARIKI